MIIELKWMFFGMWLLLTAVFLIRAIFTTDLRDDVWSMLIEPRPLPSITSKIAVCSLIVWVLMLVSKVYGWEVAL